MRYLLFLAFTVVLSRCEKNEIDKNPDAARFKGIWSLEQEYANDHWGAPLSWRDAHQEKEIKFSGNRYYEKTGGRFELRGTYKFISSSRIEIALANGALDASAIPLDYEFDDGGHLVLLKNQFEGVAGEKYRPLKN